MADTDLSSKQPNDRGAEESPEQAAAATETSFWKRFQQKHEEIMTFERRRIIGLLFDLYDVATDIYFLFVMGVPEPVETLLLPPMICASVSILVTVAFWNLGDPSEEPLSYGKFLVELYGFLNVVWANWMDLLIAVYINKMCGASVLLWVKTIKDAYRIPVDGWGSAKVFSLYAKSPIPNTGEAIPEKIRPFHFVGLVTFIMGMFFYLVSQTISEVEDNDLCESNFF